ncbi:MAG TPA: hypothetical protein VNY33_09535 [Gaiellaceae bacterium]|nr:hypothetical protein [Gaiellaceae bacterium]
MASTRSSSTSRHAADSAPAETPRHALATVARHTARIQIAAITATGNAIAGWARAADRLAQQVGEELLRRVDGETDSGELVVRVASATNVHLRELSALPSAAADHFTTRLSRVSNDN